MPGEKIPSTQKEFIDAELIVEIEAAQNQDLIESTIQDNSNILRASVVQKLLKYNALQDSFGWAVFYIGCEGSEDGDIIELPKRKEILIMTELDMSSPLIEGKYVPSIRIITNESSLPSDGNQDKLEWITEDITVSGDNDALIYISATTPKEAQMCEEGVVPAPLFMVNPKGQLTFSNNVMEDRRLTSTPGFDIAETLQEIGTGIECMPLGSIANYDDVLYALNEAMSIFEKVKTLEPAHICKF